MSRGYGVILADCPWDYRNQRLRGTTETQYPTMTMADLLALPVEQVAADNAILLLWATWPHLEDGFKVIEAWGFKYITGFPWVKVTEIAMDFDGEVKFKTSYGVGFWVRGASEPLLIARRGKVSPPKTNYVGLLSKNLGHSRKPESVHAYAEALPGPYLELFGRKERAGWDVVGNAINGRDIQNVLAEIGAVE